jgi:hypothetical protein
MARYFRRGRSKVRFLPTVASLDAPTTAEITAGTDLTGSISEMAGFEFSNSPITTPDLSTTFTTQIPGEDTTSTSTLTFYDDDTATTIRTALAKGTQGYILLQPYGTTTAKRAEVWPVTTTGVNDHWVTGNEAARFTVAFAITAAPHQSAVNP